jgi:hypothetical protein
MGHKKGPQMMRAYNFNEKMVVGRQRLHLLQFLDDFFWFVPFDAHFRSSVLLIIKVCRLIGGGSTCCFA